MNTTTIATRQIPFTRVLQHPGLMDEFVAYCRTGATEKEVQEWVKQHPSFAAAYLPASFRVLRNRLDCAAPVGGKRSPGARFYRVQSCGVIDHP
jgi:hypothetical protein